MGFGDVFKSSFLENIASVSILDMVIALVLAFGIGMFMAMTGTASRLSLIITTAAKAIMVWTNYHSTISFRIIHT